MAIPVLGIPVINRPDLLAACIRSIDHPIDRLVIIDNAPAGIVDEAVDAALDAAPAASVFVSEPPANLGYPASVNFVIRTHPAEPWWCIANADTEFGPGDLARLAAEMDGTAKWVGVVDWRVFGLSAEAVDRVGFMDENYHPCYVEDVDYERRCDLAGVPRYFIEGSTAHVGSVCWTGDDRGRANNARSYPANLAYHRAKWGGSPRGGERYETPFDAGGSVAAWTLDRRRLAANEWR